MAINFGKILSLTNKNCSNNDVSDCDLNNFVKGSLSAEQNDAVQSVYEWYCHNKGGQFHCIGGVAGCVLPETMIKVRKKSNSNVHNIKIVSEK